MSHPVIYCGDMNNRNTFEPLPAPATTSKAKNLVRSRSARPAGLVQPGNINTQTPLPTVLARRFVEMGLARTPPAFPPDGVPLVELVPYWRLWARDPQHNCLVHPGVAMFPVIAEGIASLRQGPSASQAVFAALLPIHLKETAVAQWTKYTIAAGCDSSFGGPAGPAAVLEFLLEGRPDGDRLGTWRQVLEAFFDFSGQFRFGDSSHAVALLECIGRSGLRPLAPLVCRILQGEDREIVLAAIACLARLGVPDAEMPAEALLTCFRAETVDQGRAALAFLESGGTQGGVELAKVFGQFGGPGHALAGLFRVFEAEDFGMQGLTRKINGRVGVVRFGGRVRRRVEILFSIVRA